VPFFNVTFALMVAVPFFTVAFVFAGLIVALIASAFTVYLMLPSESLTVRVTATSLVTLPVLSLTVVVVVGVVAAVSSVEPVSYS
jgi:hypothetical protein